MFENLYNGSALTNLIEQKRKVLNPIWRGRRINFHQKLGAIWLEDEKHKSITKQKSKDMNQDTFDSLMAYVFAKLKNKGKII